MPSHILKFVVLFVVALVLISRSLRDKLVADMAGGKLYVQITAGVAAYILLCT